jgi:hypothetical protein
MMDHEQWKQRREEILHEVEQNRVAKALRVSGKQHAGQRWAARWGAGRLVGHFLKLLGHPENRVDGTRAKGDPW